jgi:hypothetical protein
LFTVLLHTHFEEATKVLDRTRSKRLGSIGKVVVTLNALAIGGVLGLAILPASASGTLSVSPHTNLNDGDSVTVSGSGFATGSTGAIIECSNVTPQPTVSVLGNDVPVSCTNPLGPNGKIVTTDPSGNVPSTSFTVHTGVVGGPWTSTTTDSDQNPAATDAANFPCPPTAAQVTAGFSCVIAFGDQAKDQASQVISFSSASPPPTTPPTTTPTTLTTAPPSPGGGTVSSTSTASATANGVSPSTGQGATTTTAVKAKSSSSSLPFTGSPRSLVLMVIGGVVLLDIGYLAATVNRRPRRQRTP